VATIAGSGEQEPLTDTSRAPKIAVVDKADLGAVVDACRSLICDRFHDDNHHGAAAMLLDDGTIVTGTAPDAINPSVRFATRLSPTARRFAWADAFSPRYVCIGSRAAGRWS
jgi:cytidine deaminase